jgi:endonuclease/exonuclease/phosphatase family metal-dependent hydrolase
VPTATSTVCVPQKHTRQISVLTFNIHSARDHRGGVHLGQIGDELARWDPDVVLLQEVDRGRAWTGRVDMPSVLADRLDMAWTFGANVRRSPTNLYGTAILSRFPIVSSSNTLLPDPPGTQQRGLLHALLDIGGMKLSVYDTHLESTSYEARNRQIATIMPILRADPRPKLLGGDFNSAPTSPVLGAARSLLADTWPAVGQGESLTVPASNPRIRIDYLLYGSGDGTTVAPQDARVLLSQVSDHRAVLATYRLSASTGDVCVPVLGDGKGGSHH